MHGVQLSRAFRGHAAEEPARPMDVAAVWAGAYELQIDAVARHIGNEAAKLLGVFLRREPAAAAPRLVADSPELHVVRLAIAAGRAHVRVGGLSGRCVAV